MEPNKFALVRVWLEGWCRLPPGSRWEADRFLAEAAEVAGKDVVKVDIVPQIIGLEYVSGPGKPSQRTVRAHTLGISTKGAGLLLGYCQWRKAARTFNIDRIASVVDSDGEVHAPAGPFLREMFRTYAIGTDEERGSGAYSAFVRFHAPEFMLLRIMAGVDGEVLEVELAAIEDYAARLMMRFDPVLGTQDVERVGAWVRSLSPESGDLEDALIALERRDEPELAMLLRACKDVMTADGRHHPSEVELLEDLLVEFDV